MEIGESSVANSSNKKPQRKKTDVFEEKLRDLIRI